MSESKTFIRYQNRNPNHPDVIYATLCTPKREGKKKQNNEKWLGRVIDQEKRVYFKRDLGYYHFSANNLEVELSKKEQTYYENKDICKNSKKGTAKINRLKLTRNIIEFGSTFTIVEYIKSQNLESLFNFKSPKEHDSILSLIIYRIIEKTGYYFADYWWNSNYIKYIYPYAKLQSQRISELLVKVGKEKFFREFFINYLAYIKKFDKDNNILIDSTGLPNAIKCPCTAINNHNGIISN
jgi:hypothetical protein